jgi:hypothetical protein
VTWLHTLWFGYAWPSDKGNGPEAIMELIVVGIVTAILVPPIRDWFKAEYDKVHAKIDKGHADLHAKLDGLHDSHSELHSKLDAIIEHGVSADGRNKIKKVLGEGESD